jgi:hypothetical protein
VAELVFARRFLRDLAEFEASHSPSDVELPDRALGAIADNPGLSGRVPSFYEPEEPSYLYRAGRALVHYRAAGTRVEFLNLFFQRI